MATPVARAVGDRAVAHDWIVECMKDQPPPRSSATMTTTPVAWLYPASRYASAICTPPATIRHAGDHRPTSRLTTCAAAMEPTPYRAATAPARLVGTPCASRAGAR